MKSIDPVLIKYDRLYTDEVYNKLYFVSQQYLEYLPSLTKNIGDLYLFNFLNFEPSSDAKELVANPSAMLGIFVGCNLDKMNSYLYVYFHFINLNVPDSNQKLDRFVNGTYIFNSLLTKVKLLNENFQKYVYDYINQHNLLDKISPDTESSTYKWLKKGFTYLK